MKLKVYNVKMMGHTFDRVLAYSASDAKRTAANNLKKQYSYRQTVEYLIKKGSARLRR